MNIVESNSKRETSPSSRPGRVGNPCSRARDDRHSRFGGFLAVVAAFLITGVLWVGVSSEGTSVVRVPGFEVPNVEGSNVEGSILVEGRSGPTALDSDPARMSDGELQNLLRALGVPGTDASHRIHAWLQSASHGKPGGWVIAEATLARTFNALSPDDRKLLEARVFDPGLEVGIRCLLVRLFASRPDPESRDLLLLALSRSDSSLRWEAAISLARRQDSDPRVLSALTQRARLDEGWGRQYAFVALDRLGSDQAVQVAIEALADKEPAVVRHAAAYLAHTVARGSSRLGPAQLEQVLGAVVARHPDPTTRWVVSHHLRGSIAVP